MKGLKVVKKNLQKAWGYARMRDSVIEIDTKAKGKKHLEILIHESVHILWPDDSEEEVQRKSIILTHTIWGQKYRRIDDDNSQKMQDGSK